MFEQQLNTDFLLFLMHLSRIEAYLRYYHSPLPSRNRTLLFSRDFKNE